MKLENLERAVELGETIARITNVLDAVLRGCNSESSIYPEEMLRRHAGEKAAHLRERLDAFRKEVESL